MNTVTSVSREHLEFLPEDNSFTRSHNFCPLSGDKGRRLLRKTLANHFKPEFWGLISESGFFFCDSITCPIVYFNNETEKYLARSNVNSDVAHKMVVGETNRPICYCKNVLEQQILDELLVKKCCDSIIDIQKFTEANTGKDCVITNPTGRCCGKQVKQVLEWAMEQRLEIEAPLLEVAMSCCASIEISTSGTYEELLARETK